MPIPLKFTTSLDDSSFMHGIDRMEKTAKEFAASFSIGAGALTGIAAIGNSAIETASAIADASAAANIGGEDFQRLSFALSQSGTKAEQFTVGLQTLTSNIQNAKDGNDAAIQSFHRLGISLDSLDKNDTKEILLQIADGMKDSTNKAETMSAALDVLGKGGKKMVAGLQDGREAIEAIGTSAKIISERDLALLDQTGDMLARKWQAIKATIAGVVATALRGGSDNQETAGIESRTKALRESYEAEARDEQKLAKQKIAEQEELEDKKKADWKEALENAEKTYQRQRKNDDELAKANRDYVEQERRSQEKADEQIKDRQQERQADELKHRELMQKMARDQVMTILEGARSQMQDKLSTSQSDFSNAQGKLSRDIGDSVRRGLETPQQRHAEERQARRESREERRLNANADDALTGNAGVRRGAKSGDARRAREIAFDRRAKDAAQKDVNIAKESIKELTDAIEKLIVKP